jgi:hypothetical protein
MHKLFNKLIDEFKRLGCEIIFGNFTKIILSTGKHTYASASEYMGFLLNTIQKMDEFRLVKISIGGYWEQMLFKDELNYSGVPLLPPFNEDSYQTEEGGTSRIDSIEKRLQQEEEGVTETASSNHKRECCEEGDGTVETSDDENDLSGEEEAFVEDDRFASRDGYHPYEAAGDERSSGDEEDEELSKEQVGSRMARYQEKGGLNAMMEEEEEEEENRRRREEEQAFEADLDRDSMAPPVNHWHIFMSLPEEV